MSITFVRTKTFLHEWHRLGFTDDEIRPLIEAELEANPEKWDMIPGAGGIRKIRIAIDGRGKSGGARVLYVNFLFYEVIVLAGVYSKKKKEDITKDEKKAYKALVKAILDTLSRRRKS